MFNEKCLLLHHLQIIARPLNGAHDGIVQRIHDNPYSNEITRAAGKGDMGGLRAQVKCSWVISGFRYHL